MLKQSRTGMTLIEVVIASVVLMVLIMMSMAAFAQTNRQLGESIVMADAAARANRIESRIQELLRSAGNFTLQDLNGDGVYEAIDFNMVLGSNDAGIDYDSNLRRLVWVADGGTMPVGVTPKPDGMRSNGVLALLQGPNTGSLVLLEEIGQDLEGRDATASPVDPGFNITFLRTNGTSANGQQPAADEVEVVVSFTALGVRGANPDGSLQLHEEQRRVRVSIRNR